MRGERQVKWVMDNNRIQHIHGSAKLNTKLSSLHGPKQQQKSLVGRERTGEEKGERDWCISTGPRLL